MKESLAKKDHKNNYRTLFIRCGCYNEVLVIDYDLEYKTLDLSIFNSLIAHKMTFMQKIRLIYSIIIHGKPYTDQMVLEHYQINEVKAFLNSL